MSSSLHTLVVKDNFDRLINNIIPTFSFPICFRQLTSMIIENFDGTIEKLESLLLVTPSLVYLKLIGGENMLDGKRWEQFIEINLPQLDKFEFFFKEWNTIKQTSADLELIIASFRTPFWIEHKKWFVIGKFDMTYSSTIYLYSIPLCTSCLRYQTRYKKDFLSICTMATEDDSITMNNIKSLNLNWDKALADQIQEKVCYLNRYRRGRQGLVIVLFVSHTSYQQNA
jgi:hypothetical protein